MIPSTGINIVETKLGLGRHIWYILDTNPEVLVPYYKASHTTFFRITTI